MTPDAKGKKEGKPRTSQGGGKTSLPRGPKVSSCSKTLAFWVLLLLLPYTIYNFLNMNREEVVEINYSEFRKQLSGGNIASVIIVEKEISGELKSPGTWTHDGVQGDYSKFQTFIPFEAPTLVSGLA